MIGVLASTTSIFFAFGGQGKARAVLIASGLVCTLLAAAAIIDSMGLTRP